MSFTPQPGAYGLGTPQQPTTGNKRNINNAGGDTTQQGGSKKSRMAPQVGAADSRDQHADDQDDQPPLEEDFDNEMDREEVLEKTATSRAAKIRNITRLLRRNPGLQPRTYKELEINLKQYTEEELDEIYENLIFDVQSRGGAPVGEMGVQIATYPFNSRLPMFREICMSDENLKRDIEIEFGEHIANISTRLLIAIRFINNFVRALNIRPVRREGRVTDADDEDNDRGDKEVQFSNFGNATQAEHNQQDTQQQETNTNQSTTTFVAPPHTTQLRTGQFESNQYAQEKEHPSTISLI